MPYVGNISTTFNTFSATDVSVTDDLTVTDDASVGGDLAITGATTVGGNTTVTGTTTLTGNVGIGITASTGKLDVLLDTDKRIFFSGGIGEIGSTAGFQAINSAGSALTGFGIRASEIRFATESTEKMRIDANGAITMPLQPAFLARPASEQSNFATGSVQTVAFGTEVFDQNADFASNTFTAPVTGKYQLSCSVYVTALDSASTYYEVSIRTSNRNYFVIIDPDFGQDAGFWAFTLSVLADMDASDTATVGINQASGTAQTDIGTSSYFSGFLAC